MYGCARCCARCFDRGLPEQLTILVGYTLAFCGKTGKMCYSPHVPEVTHRLVAIYHVTLDGLGRERISATWVDHLPFWGLVSNLHLWGLCSPGFIAIWFTPGRGPPTIQQLWVSIGALLKLRSQCPPFATSLFKPFGHQKVRTPQNRAIEVQGQFRATVPCLRLRGPRRHAEPSVSRRPTALLSPEFWVRFHIRVWVSA